MSRVSCTHVVADRGTARRDPVATGTSRPTARGSCGDRASEPRAMTDAGRPDPAPGPDHASLGWTRRRFLATSGAVAASLATGLGTGSRGTRIRPRADAATGPAEPDAAGIVAADLPSEEEIFGWIRTITEQGIRRPGYPADVWAEDWIERRFTEFGLADVHREEVPLRSWRPGRSSLRVTTADGRPASLDHFPVPYSASTRSLDLRLVDGDAAAPGSGGRRGTRRGGAHHPPGHDTRPHGRRPPGHDRENRRRR